MSNKRFRNGAKRADRERQAAVTPEQRQGRLLEQQRQSRQYVADALRGWAALAKTGSGGTTQTQEWYIAATNMDGMDVMVKVTLDVWARECMASRDGLHEFDEAGTCGFCARNLVEEAARAEAAKITKLGPSYHMTEEAMQGLEGLR